MNVGYVQYEVVFGDRDANMQTAASLVRQIPDADLLVLPELGLTGYDFIDKDELASLAEPAADGPTAAFLKGLASEMNCTLVLGFPERDGNAVYNACLLVTPRGEMHVYRKIHLFSRETTLFTPGDAPPPVIDTPAGRVGLMICFDWIFPETARVLALKGAQIIAHPSNLVLQFCQRAMFARSVENSVFSITSNRTGEENRAGRTLRFTGASQVIGPRGDVLASAPDDEAHVCAVEIDPAQADDKQITEFNHLQKDRRTSLYDGLV